MTYPNRGERSYFEATCAKCGTACQVPFKPSGRREVFCSKCFEMNGGGSRDKGFEASRSSRTYGRREFGGGQDKQMFGATCDQCGERCEVPFRPSTGKPIWCSHCFAEKNNDRGADARGGSYSSPLSPKSCDLDLINTKLDKILRLLSPSPSEPKIVENSLEKKVAKEITSKILEEIEAGSGKKAGSTKKKAKSGTKKKSK